MSSIYRISDSVIINVASPIPVDTNLFTTPIQIPLDDLQPGRGGMVRVWFAVATTGNANTAIKVIRTNPAGTLPLVNEVGFVNGDLDFKIKSKGIYWFDIPVMAGTTINLQSTTSPDATITGVSIVSVDFLDFQKIIFGA